MEGQRERNTKLSRATKAVSPLGSSRSSRYTANGNSICQLQLLRRGAGALLGRHRALLLLRAHRPHRLRRRSRPVRQQTDQIAPLTGRSTEEVGGKQATTPGSHENQTWLRNSIDCDCWHSTII